LVFLFVVGLPFLEGFLRFPQRKTWCFDGFWVVICGQNVVFCTTFSGTENFSFS